MLVSSVLITVINGAFDLTVFLTVAKWTVYNKDIKCSAQTLCLCDSVCCIDCWSH